MKILRLFLLNICLVPSLAYPDQTDARLNDLFLTLTVSSDLSTIRETESQIWEIWFQHPNEDVEQIMQMGVARMNYNRYADAMLIFTQLIESYPDYAEGWNRRATLHYVLGNYEESIKDIEQVLTLASALRSAIGIGASIFTAKSAKQGKASVRKFNRRTPQQPKRSREPRTN